VRRVAGRVLVERRGREAELPPPEDPGHAETNGVRLTCGGHAAVVVRHQGEPGATVLTCQLSDEPRHQGHLPGHAFRAREGVEFSELGADTLLELRQGVPLGGRWREALARILEIRPVREPRRLVCRIVFLLVIIPLVPRLPEAQALRRHRRVGAVLVARLDLPLDSEMLCLLGDHRADVPLPVGAHIDHGLVLPGGFRPRTLGHAGVGPSLEQPRKGALSPLDPPSLLESLLDGNYSGAIQNWKIWGPVGASPHTPGLPAAPAGWARGARLGWRSVHKRGQLTGLNIARDDT
jgi:hypothetical protein